MSKLLTGTAYKVFVCRNQTAPQKVVVLQGAVNNDLREQLLAPLPMEEYLGSKFALCTQWTYYRSITADMSFNRVYSLY